MLEKKLIYILLPSPQKITSKADFAYTPQKNTKKPTNLPKKHDHFRFPKAETDKLPKTEPWEIPRPNKEWSIGIIHIKDSLLPMGPSRFGPTGLNLGEKKNQVRFLGPVGRCRVGLGRGGAMRSSLWVLQCGAAEKSSLRVGCRGAEAWLVV